jgi:glutamate 5-kinase
MRERVKTAKRIVVKVGSTSLTGANGRLDTSRVDTLVADLCDLVASGREMVCVSSGAVAAGLDPLGLKSRPKDMPTLQAAAAVGQSHLMDAYATAFESRGHVCGQVLVTRNDFVHRQQYVNALNTFNRLLALRAVPIVNENDTVATDEIRFGENDLLAALVANLVRADLLVLLSDVDGLHEGANGPVIAEVERITPEIDALAGGSATQHGSGGMRTKVDAARIATASGVPVVIARSKVGAIKEILDGDVVGTLFHASASKLTSRKAWIGYAATPQGRVIVDAGARTAVADRNRSLLAAGVKDVEGSFAVGDAVDIADEAGVTFARGLVGFSSDELSKIAGKGSDEVSKLTGGSREVVHRDELVMLQPS